MQNSKSLIVRRAFRCSLIVFGAWVAGASPAFHAAAPVQYRFTFPEPQHRWMQVEATFPDDVRQTLELRMIRASPCRYSFLEFEKNVYDVHAFARDGREVATARPDPYGWNVADHGETVKVTY